MQYFHSKYDLLPGTDYLEVIRYARREHQTIQKQTPRRQPYVRSKYFKGDKVFVGVFWNHLVQKRKGEQIKRAKLYACAIELLRDSTVMPITIIDRAYSSEVFYRFSGRTKKGAQYFVQVKQNKRTGRKDFMSVFPKSSSKK